MVRIHQHAKFQAIPSMHSLGNARKRQIWPISLSQNSTKIRQIYSLLLYSNLLWRWSRYITMQNFQPLPQCILWEMPGNQSRSQDTACRHWNHYIFLTVYQQCCIMSNWAQHRHKWNTSCVPVFWATSCKTDKPYHIIITIGAGNGRLPAGCQASAWINHDLLLFLNGPK